MTPSATPSPTEISMEVDNGPGTNGKPQKHPFLPDLSPDLKIKEECEFKWEIKSYADLVQKSRSHPQKKTFSPEFIVNEHKWRVLMFPTGNNSDHLSIYLDFADVDKVSKNWHECVQFSIRLSNPSDDSVHFFMDAKHRYVIEESDWGFTKFYPLKNLSLPNIDGKAFLENDAFNLHVYMRVVEDTLGTLWHSFVNWDSKRETGFVGFRNQGATCYMNSLLQSLYFTNFFRKAVFQIPTQDEEPTKSVALALQRVFYHLQFDDDAVDTRELTKSFGWDTLDAFMQHDVQEFNRVLQDSLENKMKKTVAEGSIEKLFVGKMKSYIKCVNVNFESSREETFYDIQLNVKGKANLYESFKDYIEVEMLDGENKYQSEKYGLQDAKKGVIFTKYPPVLHLQLKRFEYDFQRDTMVKINDRHEYPLEINLNDFLENPDGSKPQLYHLHGVLVHSGDVHGGHYCAFLRPMKENRWFKFDDDRVTPVSEKEVFEDNFGGDPLDDPKADRTKLPQQPPVQTKRQLLKRFTNAYMLVYIRDSDRDEILSDVTEKDIPQHLRDLISKEMKDQEDREKEMAEKHLYMQLRLLDEKSVREYQGFDLCPAEGGVGNLRKVAKALKFGELKDLLAEQYGISVEKLRVWNFYRRQNQTERPENPIPNAADDKTLEELAMNLGIRGTELRLYVEVAKHQTQDFDGKIVFFPQITSENCVLFIKFFDQKAGKIENLGPITAKKSMRGSDLVSILAEMKKLPPSTNIKIFEEIKPGMINPIKSKNTLAQADIQTGDILCFEIVLSSTEETKVTYSSVVQYYQYLKNRFVVQFRPKNRIESSADRVFELEMSKQYSYDQFAARVAKELSITDPYKIRFMINQSGGDTPKSYLRGNQTSTMNEIISQNFYRTNYSPLVFWYELLDVSILELENMRTMNVTLLDGHLREKDVLSLMVSKNGTIGDLSKAIETKNHNTPLRIYLVSKNREIVELALTTPLSEISDYGSTICADMEQTPSQLIGSPNSKMISFFHYHKDILRTHSIPFRMGVSPGMSVNELLKKIQQRLAEKDVSKFVLSVVSSNGKVRVLEDMDEKIGDVITANDSIGIDHPDRSARRNISFEKAIKIN